MEAISKNKLGVKLGSKEKGNVPAISGEYPVPNFAKALWKEVRYIFLSAGRECF